MIYRYILNLFPDTLFIRLRYFKRFKRILHLRKPKRFTEKIMWYKLFYHDNLMTICADKYRVREYIKEKGVGDILVPLFKVYNTPDEIKIDELPCQFILKGNNGSETNLVVRDKSKITEKYIRHIVSGWMANNQVITLGKEWCYQNIEFKITVEQLLESEGEDGIDDYKFLCFNGRVHYIWVDKNRFTSHTRTFFDRDWNVINVESDHPAASFSIDKPWGFERMLHIAEDIGKDFPFARVDFYSVNKKVYFGEITFYPWSGMVQFQPDSFDFDMGDKFILPKEML